MNEKRTDKTTLDEITPRQLRKILFHIDDEKMTVKELRAKLYDVREQDELVAVDFSMSYKLGVQ